MTLNFRSSLTHSVVLLGLFGAVGCGPGEPVCPAIAFDCAEGFAPADTDGDGCDDACEETATCTAEPVCNGGHMQVENESACLQDDAVCYERTECGTTIWCTGEDFTPCMLDSECAANEYCDTENFCDAPANCGSDGSQCLVACAGRCVEQDITCDAEPVCDAGDTEVASQSGCLQDDAVCYQRTECGTTIWCTGPA